MLPQRVWIPIKSNVAENSISLVSYNILAQSLIRRQLYPWASSAALKVKGRFDRVLQELKTLDADVMTLQEVDRWDDTIQPGLKSMDYESCYVRKYKIPGPNYLDSGNTIPSEQTSDPTDAEHGICIAWKSHLFSLIDSKTFSFDELTGGVSGNVLQLVALKSKKDNTSFIVTNHHLWWRPDGQAMRLRQIAALYKVAMEFSQELNLPVIFSGDWNVNADDIVYSVISGSKLTQQEQERLESLLGPLTTETLHQIAQVKITSSHANYPLFDTDHCTDPAWQSGQGWNHEPCWTTYARSISLQTGWSGTLDYICSLDNLTERKIVFNSLLKLPPVSTVQEGIPNDIYPSDHIPIGVKFTVE